jgi:hypothetical protein
MACGLGDLAPLLSSELFPHEESPNPAAQMARFGRGGNKNAQPPLARKGAVPAPVENAWSGCRKRLQQLVPFVPIALPDT